MPQTESPALNTSEGVRQQQQEVLRLGALLEAILTLAQQAVREDATTTITGNNTTETVSPIAAELVRAAEGSGDMTVTRPSNDLHASQGDDASLVSVLLIPTQAGFNMQALLLVERAGTPSSEFACSTLQIVSMGWLQR